MESHFVLVVIIAASFSCFLVTCSYGTFLESAVDIKVTGNNIARSGVNQYTVFGNFKLEYINCTVKNDTKKPWEVTLLNNGEPIHHSKDNGNGYYTCGAKFEIKKPSFSARYYINKEVEFITDKNTFIIASDVGSRVYIGEQISLSCDGHYSEKMEAQGTISADYYGLIDNDYEDECPVSLIGPFSTIDINSVGEKKVTCDLRQFDQAPPEGFEAKSTCSKPIFLTLDVVSELNVSLAPLYFDRVSKNLTFVCTSDPPRLMYWTVLNTEHANIMDIQNLSLPGIPANTTVNITQKPGKTSIVIQIVGEDDNTDNGIQTVICSTYDTNAHVIKTARRTQHSAFANQVGGGVITLMTVLSLFVIVLVIVVVFLLRRLHQIRGLSLKSPDGSNDGDDKAPSETVLQDNPAYLPYTGTDDVSP